MQHIKAFAVDFASFYLCIVLHLAKIVCAVLACIMHGINSMMVHMMVPLVQHMVEMVGHMVVVMCHGTVLALGHALIKISDMCMQMSQCLCNQARHIESKYRWL